MDNQIDTAELSSSKRTVDTPPAAVDDYQFPRSMPKPGSKITSGAVGDAPFSPTPSLDPRNIQAIEHYQEFEGYLAPALNAFSTAHIGLSDIANARAQAQKNPSWNEWQIVLNVAGFAEKKQEAMTRQFDKAFKDLNTAAVALEQSLSAPLEQQAAAGSINAEIRAYVKALPSDERTKFITDAFEKRKSKVLTAILGADGFLSGFSDETVVHLTRKFHEERNPEAVRRLKATQAAIALIGERAGRVFNQVEKALGCSFAKVRQLREADHNARKALLMQD
jgi:hypothetical protein